MPKTKHPILRIILYALLILLILGAGIAIGAQRPIPWRVLTTYPTQTLAEEAYLMNDCLECHAAADLHTCQTCHDDHGAVELADLPFFATIAFVGDVPDPGYVFLDDVLPFQDQPHTHRTLLSFLEEQGVQDFVSVTLVSGDGGFVTIAPDQLTDQALLLPYTDGIRFASEDLHVSSWLKNISRIIVVGEETPLKIDGNETSLGRLLLGPTQEVTVEETQVMLKSDEDGQVRTAKVASRIQGASVLQHVINPAFDSLRILDSQGQTYSLNWDEAQDALLASVQGEVALILPARGRSQWIRDVVEIQSMEE